MPGPLLVTSEDHLDILLLVQNVENLQHDASRKTKERFHAFLFQTFEKYLRSRELHDPTPLARTLTVQFGPHD